MARTTLHSLADEFKIRSASLPTSEQNKLFLEVLERVFAAGYTAMQFASAIRVHTLVSGQMPANAGVSSAPNQSATVGAISGRRP